MKLTILRNVAASVLLAGCAILAAGQLDGTTRTLAGPTPPSSCAPMLQDLKAWATSGDANQQHLVDFAIATNGYNRLVSYTNGSLTYRRVLRPSLHEYLSGTGTQYFSDRFTTVSPRGGGFAQAQPFSALATDRLGVSIDLGSGAVALTLLSWGNGRVNVPAVQCTDSVLYGFSTTGRGYLWAVSFSKRATPPTR